MKDIMMAVVALGVLGLAVMGYLGYAGRSDASAVADFCKGAIEEQLVAPASAVYPEFRPRPVQGLTGQDLEIESYVDSQNRMGAMLRTRFTCRVAIDGRGSPFHATATLQIEEEP